MQFEKLPVLDTLYYDHSVTCNGGDLHIKRRVNS